MAKASAPQRSRSFWPEFADLFEGLPSWAHLRTALGHHVIRVEDENKDGTYRIRAEIPGVDPAKDVEVTVRDGLLTIKAHRTENKEANGRSEFSYGSFLRSVTLPPGADVESVTADYDQGILIVSVPVGQAIEPDEKRIAVNSPSK